MKAVYYILFRFAPAATVIPILITIPTVPAPAASDAPSACDGFAYVYLTFFIRPTSAYFVAFNFAINSTADSPMEKKRRIRTTTSSSMSGVQNDLKGGHYCCLELGLIRDELQEIRKILSFKSPSLYSTVSCKTETNKFKQTTLLKLMDKQQESSFCASNDKNQNQTNSSLEYSERNLIDFLLQELRGIKKMGLKVCHFVILYCYFIISFSLN